MVLHGKLVDQLGTPYSNTMIGFTATRVSRFQLPIPYADGGETTWLAYAVTGQDGTFTIDAGSGTRLNEGTTPEPGYFKGNMPGPFYYGRNASQGRDHGDAKHPVVFMWWNDRFKRVIVRDVTCHPGHGVYSLDYLSGEVSTTMAVLEHIEFAVIRPGGNPQRPFDWSISVCDPHEGIVDAHGPLESEAPEGGYLRKLNYTMLASQADWSPQIIARFYTRDKQWGGPDTFAGVELRANLGSNSQDPSVTFHYCVNLSHTRDLTPRPIKN